MHTQQAKQSSLEKRLRQSAPTLRPTNVARVDAACAHVASAPPPSPLTTPRTFTRPLLRIAACLTLMLGIALLMRPKTQPGAPVPPLPSFAAFHDLTDLMVPPALKNTLASEAEDLVSDLADLTVTLNERSLAILF